MPPKYAPILFGLILSGMMSLVVSGIATLKATGLVPEFLSLWMTSWSVSWAVAFPTVLIFAPMVRRLVARLTQD